MTPAGTHAFPHAAMGFVEASNKCFQLPLFPVDSIMFCLFLNFIYLLLHRGDGRERGKHQRVVVSPSFPIGDWPETLACALTGNPTGDPLVHRPALNPLSHTIQGCFVFCFVLFLMLFSGFFGLYSEGKNFSDLVLIFASPNLD